jgi:hypothetical protein
MVLTPVTTKGGRPSGAPGMGLGAFPWGKVLQESGNDQFK